MKEPRMQKPREHCQMTMGLRVCHDNAAMSLHRMHEGEEAGDRGLQKALVGKVPRHHRRE